jgi:hypothetical protein
MECKRKAPARPPLDYRFLFPFSFLFGSWWSLLLYVTSFVTSRRNGWTDRVSYCYIDGAKISIGVSIDFIFPKAFSSTIEQNLIQIKIL